MRGTIPLAGSAVLAILARERSGVGPSSRSKNRPLERASLVVSAAPSEGTAPVRRDEFSITGIFDVDWLTEPRFERLLDHMAASPGAFTAVRVFGALTAGARETTLPAGGGAVSSGVGAPMDFSATFRALESLTSRGLIPFVVLSFFPPAISPSPVVPPPTFDDWQRLVRGFLDALVADRRFGGAAIQGWWFEVWNEPNFPWFWDGSFARYLDLYRATSEAVGASGHRIRLGGPALAWLDEGAGERAAMPLMERFLRFLAAEPAVQCDFISLHGKGTWGADPPRLERPVGAAEATARAALAIDPDRFHGMTIVNNEADMKVGFDVPFEPRMTEQFPAWLVAVMTAYNRLTSEFHGARLRFLAAADNANQHLVQAPFDGRRSIMTRTSASVTDLVKAPVYGFYELVRLLGDRHGVVLAGEEQCYPRSELFHTFTVAAGHATALLCVYPWPSGTEPRSWQVTYTIRDLPWPRVNVVRFRIDRTHANAYTAAGRTLDTTLDRATARRVRQAQELALDAPARRGVAVPDGTLTETFALEPSAVTAWWITPFVTEAPAAPEWLEAVIEDGNVILRWQPSREPLFYSYDVSLTGHGAAARLLSPVPLRPAMWVDTAPPHGIRTYAVRAVSASGISSRPVVSRPVVIDGR